MHFMKVLNPDNIGADFFVDKDMNPIEITLTIKDVTSEKPPTGGKLKACFFFDEIKETVTEKNQEKVIHKKCFLANGEVKKIARTTRRADTKDWIGLKLTITCKEKRFGRDNVMGMVITKINGSEV